MPRLEQLLARNLGCSRADIRRLVARTAIVDSRHQPLVDPRVEIDGSALPLVVHIDGRDVALHDSSHLLLHKPVGFVTALTDAVHPVASSLLADAPLAGELRALGRLDLDTSGLLLWTTEGAWLQRLTHPKRRVPRTYQAALARPFTPLTDTLTLHDGHRPVIDSLTVIDAANVHPALVRPAGTQVYATITIVGGAYHEVRRIFAALGSHVLALCRVSFGDIVLPTDLAPGHWRPLAIERVWPPAGLAS